MPKIIENARERLIQEARTQIEIDGYDSVTIRSIARGCQIGLGTFYNYFKSKDVLIATYLLEEWEERLQRINLQGETETDPMEFLKTVNLELGEFIKKNVSVFSAEGAIKAFRGSARVYHNLLINQISEPLTKICERNGYENAEFLAQFASESILTWTVARKNFDEISAVMKKLFVK
jgi:AcrR family transcriptional regulator